jgi:hypothetical protein
MCCVGFRTAPLLGIEPTLRCKTREQADINERREKRRKAAKLAVKQSVAGRLGPV